MRRGARAPAADCVFWSLNPQVHATDDWSVMETIEAQPATAATARRCTTAPLVVSPITLRQRFNPVATDQRDTAAPADTLPPQVDPRQRTPFAAAWTVGTLAALTAAGVGSMTLFETTGWRGLLESTAGSPKPALFPSRPGQRFPVYEIFSVIARATAFAIPDAPASAGRLAVRGCLRAGGLNAVLLANLTPELQAVRVAGLARPLPATRLTLDRRGDPSWLPSPAGEIVLPPFGVARLAGG